MNKQRTRQPITLWQLLQSMSVDQMVKWALTLDPNSSWDESVEFDSSITADDLRSALMAAYDDQDTYQWINR